MDPAATPARFCDMVQSASRARSLIEKREQGIGAGKDVSLYAAPEEI